MEFLRPASLAEAIAAKAEHPAATMEATSARGRRLIPLVEFFTGPKPSAPREGMARDAA